MNRNEPIVRMRDLRKNYDGKTLVLHGIDLDVFPGQIIGYIGPNGAGKTTTVKILTGMLEGIGLAYGQYRLTVYPYVVIAAIIPMAFLVFHFFHRYKRTTWKVASQFP